MPGLTMRREGALDILHEYWEEIGGRPEPGKGKKRKGRKSTGAEESETGTPAATTKRPKKEVEWSPPPGSWENEVEYVDTVVEEEGVRYALLIWNNQKKTQHPLHHVYQKCPQKMLQYYESHL
jgi:chromobox protein 1